MPKDTLSLFLKQKNIAEVLKIVHLEQEVSRAKIAALTGIAPSTVSSIVDKLEKEQIVEYTEESLVPSSIGRPPLLLRFNPKSFYVLGIEINLLSSQVVIVGIEPKEIDYGLELSPELERKIPDITAMVLKEIAANP